MNEDNLVDEIQALDREKDDVISRALRVLRTIEAAGVSDISAVLECRALLEDVTLNPWFTAAALWAASDIREAHAGSSSGWSSSLDARDRIEIPRLSV